MKTTKMILALLVVSLNMVAFVSAIEPIPTSWPITIEWKGKLGNAEDECERLAKYMEDTYGIVGDCDFAYKIDDWSGNMDDTYLDYPNSITISNSDGKTFDWSSDVPVCAVIVKASTYANIYYYDPPVLGDTGLVAPEGKDISHVTFCMKVPDFKVPETTMGTVASLITMLGAAILLRSKVPLLK